MTDYEMKVMYAKREAAPFLHVGKALRQAGVIRHPLVLPITLDRMYGEVGQLDCEIVPLCETPLPAKVCTCGKYVLLEDTQGA